VVSFAQSSQVYVPGARSSFGDLTKSASSSSAATSERHRAILRILAEYGRVTVSEIAERFDISHATARRDAVLLATTGKAARNHGCLIPAKTFPGERNFRAKSVLQHSAKVQIAQRAAQILPHEGCVFVDAGTTCLEVARLLISRSKLRIVTNSIPVIELVHQAKATVIGIGGEVRRVSLALTGALTQTWLADLHFDAVVVGAAGVDPGNGAYTSEIHEAALKGEALRRGTNRILVADAEKWNRPAAVHFAPWSAFTSFVTNQQVPRDVRVLLAGGSVPVARTWSA
jgi:DeoR/GlpR family transcriptional regulator of sugar metabolism